LLRLNQRVPDVVLLDITLPGQDGVDLLKNIHSRLPDMPVIMLTAVDKIQTVVECIKIGAFDYLAKPIIVEELITSINRALESVEIRRELDQRRELQIAQNKEYRLLGNSEGLNRVRKHIQTVGPTDAPVLITGETGTGKELAAREIHACSLRAREPFVAINCGAIPRDLFETEFFGYKKGAFTGAQSSEIGKIQLANRGTLLLDEIGELPIEAQTKLLRILEENEFYPIGSTQLVQVDIRIIASTNKRLDEMVRQRTFREDLFFRINVYTIEIPPLRERSEDILLIADHFMKRFNWKFGKNFQSISKQASDVLTQHSWKGNIRELRNVMERAILSEDSDVLLPEHLLGLFTSPVFSENEEMFTLPETGIDLEQTEKQFIIQALRITNGNKTKAAKLLNLSPPTLYYRLEKFGLS
jgi:DNA-binding NtrC family response regulator